MKAKQNIDPNMVCCEIYNPSLEELIFTETRPVWVPVVIMPDGKKAPQIIRCKPQGFCFLPHQYYTVTNQSGAPIKLIKNFGDEMFKKNTLPSRPDVKKVLR